MTLEKNQVTVLREICSAIRDNPEILTLPDLQFFLDFMSDHSNGAFFRDVTEFEEEDMPPMFEDDNNHNEMERLKGEGKLALFDGDSKKAIDCFSKCLRVNNTSGLLCALRAEAFMLSMDYKAAIRDCDKALVLNPELGKAFNVRARANARLHLWDAALKDLTTAQAIDFDEQLCALESEIREKKGSEVEEVEVVAPSFNVPFSPDVLKNITPEMMATAQDLLANPEMLSQCLNSIQPDQLQTAMNSMMGNGSKS